MEWGLRPCDTQYLARECHKSMLQSECWARAASEFRVSPVLSWEWTAIALQPLLKRLQFLHCQLTNKHLLPSLQANVERSIPRDYSVARNAVNPNSEHLR